MPRWLKIAIILLSACALALGLLVGGAAWWFHANKDRLVKEGRAATTGGESFGATHAQRACIDDALTHVKTCGQMGIMCEATTKIRLTSCLSVARRDGTCNGLPGPGDLMKGAVWENDECTRRGQPGSQPCARLLRGVIEACAAENDGG